MTVKDTICAIATGMGNSGIGIVRISGDDAIPIADRIFKGKKRIKDMPSYTAAYGNICDENGELIDEAVLLVMKAPHTYTTEDVVEIDCHGGIIILKKIMELIIRNGARAAEPGEFTKRAFLGGRIDMSQAEAVMELIGAKSDMALKSSLHQLKGELRDKIKEMRETLLYNIAFIESALDDPENYSLDGYPEKLLEIVEGLRESINRLLKTCENGRLVKEGIKTVIVGRPNAGKSSVLNMILGEERAIVTGVEGTTRDTLEEVININGIILKLVDTAGIRTTEDIVEKIGVDKALENINDADLILYIVDGSKELDENDNQIIGRIKDKRVITLVNKNDLDIVVDKEKLRELLYGKGQEKESRIIEISAKNKTGKEKLHDMLNEMFFSGEVSYNDELYITNMRHKEALMAAEESLGNVQNSIEAGMGEDFFTIDMMDAYESLGLIIGEALGDDLAEKIFSEFCMGK